MLGIRQEEAALRAEPLDQGGRDQADLAGDLGQGEPSRTDADEDAGGGGDQVVGSARRSPTKRSTSRAISSARPESWASNASAGTPPGSAEG